MEFDPHSFVAGAPQQESGEFDPHAFVGGAAHAPPQKEPWYNRAAKQIEKITVPFGNAQAKIESAIPYLAGLTQGPLEGVSQYAAQKLFNRIPQAAQAGGEYAAENLPRTGMSPTASAAIGTGIAMSPQIAGAFLPGPKFGKVRAFEPVIPAERAVAVGAAQDLGLPLTRAELTGSKAAAGLENTLEKTPMGGPVIQRLRDAQYAKLQQAKEGLQGKMGTGQDVYASGQQAQASIAQRMAEMNARRRELFDQVPDNVHIPLKNAKDVADQIALEQSQYLPTTRNGDVLSIASDIQKAHSSTGEGINTGPEYHGVTENVGGEPNYGVKASFSPEQGQARAPQKLPVMPNTTTGDPHALFDYTDPITGKDSYKIQGDASQLGYKTTPNVPLETVQGHGIPIKGMTEKAAKLGHEPTDLPSQQASLASFEPKSNYQQLKRTREVLSGKINESLRAGREVEARDYMRLKSAIDQDIQGFVSGQTKPLDSMVAKQFSDTYKQANAFSGQYKEIFKTPEAKVLQNAPPEKIVDLVFKKNNETAINNFRAAAGEEGFSAAKQKFTQDLLESTNLSKELSKYKPGTLQAIYSPEELGRLRKYGLAQSIPKTTTGLQGTQGSARNNIQAGQYYAMGSGLLGAGGSLMHGNVPGAVGLAAGGAAQFVLPNIAAKAYLGATNGIPIPATEAMRAGAAGRQNVPDDDQIKNALSGLLMKMRKNKRP